MRIGSLLFFILFCFYQSAIADTFLVTTNDDAGAGSLREAITKAAANGIIVKDFIYFNLPGNTATDRMISIKSNLPRLSSNLVIDASTQPGDPLGGSTAKITIKPGADFISASSIAAVFYISRSADIEIYGFHIADFTYIKSSTYTGSAIGTAVFVINSDNITIGAPGRGNVFTRNEFAINVSTSDSELFYQPLCKNIKIRSNWIGLDPSGNESDCQIGVSVSAEGCEIGGETKSEGNIWGGYFVSALSLGGTSLLVSNNKFGFVISGGITVPKSIMKILIGANGLSFKDNVASHFRVELSSSKNFQINGNTETLIGLQVINSFLLTFCEDGKFGTDQDEEKNTLVNSSAAITTHYCKNIEMGKNSIICSDIAYNPQNSVDKLPQIHVLVNTDTEYSGTATPNSEVYIYNDNTSCETCSPADFFAKIRTNASGDWKITGDFREKRLVANSTLIGNSSEYTQPLIGFEKYSHSDIHINPVCGENNGSIKLLNLMHVLKVEWFNDQNQKVGEGSEIKNLGPGTYYAKASNGNCYTRSQNIKLENSVPIIHDQLLQIIRPSCGLNNGSIKGLIGANTVYDVLETKWIDKSNTVITTGTSDLNNVPPGEYTFIVTNSGGCSTSYGPIVLANQSGPSIDQTALAITGSYCDASTGSIENIKVAGTGTITYIWRNADGVTVGMQNDLQNVPAGQYTLEVSDDSSCPALQSQPIIVNEINGIEINNTNVVIQKASCNGANGRISGLLVTGATNYKWLDSDNNQVGTTLELRQVPPGKYRLVASNSSCKEESEEFTVGQLTSGNTYTLASRTTNTTCNQNNGILVVSSVSGQPTAFRWQNSAGITIGNSAILENVPAGDYFLYITNELGCEYFYQQYSIKNTETATINRTEELVTNDKCGLSLGRIIAPSLVGGVPPYYYSWTDHNGHEISRKSVLENVVSGTYQLIIGDEVACARRSFTYTVFDDSDVTEAPHISDISICAPGNATIMVTQPSPGIYTLYDENGTQLDQNETGMFRVNIKNSGNYLITRRKGHCESNPTPVKITIQNEGIADIGNTFSPNGDNVNDVWNIPGITNYPNATISIFNRYGNKVFGCTGYEKPFDGTFNGSALPTGIYYYIIDLKRGCDILTGSLSLIR